MYTEALSIAEYADSEEICIPTGLLEKLYANRAAAYLNIVPVSRRWLSHLSFFSVSDHITLNSLPVWHLQSVYMCSWIEVQVKSKILINSFWSHDTVTCMLWISRTSVFLAKDFLQLLCVNKSSTSKDNSQTVGLKRTQVLKYFYKFKRRAPFCTLLLSLFSLGWIFCFWPISQCQHLSGLTHWMLTVGVCLPLAGGYGKNKSQFFYMAESRSQFYHDSWIFHIGSEYCKLRQLQGQQVCLQTYDRLMFGSWFSKMMLF